MYYDTIMIFIHYIKRLFIDIMVESQHGCVLAGDVMLQGRRRAISKVIRESLPDDLEAGIFSQDAKKMKTSNQRKSYR